jgi:hypothetical protein
MGYRLFGRTRTSFALRFIMAGAAMKFSRRALSATSGRRWMRLGER